MTDTLAESSLRTGTSLTRLGYGAAQLGNLYQSISDEEATSAVDAAWDAGIRYFDTAPHYGLGLSERRLGAALARHPRNEYVLSTKVGRRLVATPERAHLSDEHGFAVPASYVREWDFSADGVRRSLEGSLDRLGVDRVDIVYLHDPDDHWPEASTTALDALLELRDQGVISAVGVGMNQATMLARFVRERDVDLVMCAGRLTLLDQAAHEDLLPAAAERGVAVVAAAVYNSGLLSRARPPADARYDYQRAPQDLHRRALQIADVAEQHGLTLPDLAVQYPLQFAPVASVVLGMRTPAHVRTNVDRMRAQVPEEIWTEMDRRGLVPAPQTEEMERTTR
ncbi:aldo/keto reductase [Ruania zhangjianzhongii]|uniref:aldo/keto reductase n=1 Tax=Ruania zhangjianzhongii TaxID=2603206 RepID=UPI0011C714A5|nr:aldo/keto reductase [Ruania zhangjianzhongii]